VERWGVEAEGKSGKSPPVATSFYDVEIKPPPHLGFNYHLLSSLCEVEGEGGRRGCGLKWKVYQAIDTNAPAANCLFQDQNKDTPCFPLPLAQISSRSRMGRKEEWLWG
jgi:hypothetical protein